jgi:signal transduction histidine kinase
MSLHYRLVVLLNAFAAFAVLATFVTIYAVRMQSEGALSDIRRTEADAQRLELLRIEAREQQVRLHEVIAGVRPLDDHFSEEFEAFVGKLDQVTQFTLAQRDPNIAAEIVKLAFFLRKADQELDAYLRDQSSENARQVYEERFVGTLFPAVDKRLFEARTNLNATSKEHVETLETGTLQVLTLSAGVAVVGLLLVGLGIMLMRRWIVRPVQSIEAAVGEYSSGNLAHRVPLLRDDELGRLGAALNNMAAALSQAEEGLRTSETKYRALFSNLRDAAILCDARGTVLECHEGEIEFLRRVATPGIPFADFWQNASVDLLDWPSIFGRVLTARERVRVGDIRLRSPIERQRTFVVELLAFPIEIDAEIAVAIVLRDITAQRHSEIQIRRAEAMEATVTLARGVAHDFSSLLTAAIGALSLLNPELTDRRLTDLLNRALRACGQAVSLSRTLLTFAGGIRGNPEPLRLGETVELILQSLPEESLARVQIDTELDAYVMALIDRDQFTEIVLNLVRNACEAMPSGGRLGITLTAARAPGSDSAGPTTHALLSVSDTGCGFGPDVQERIFEPFFTTKTAGVQRSRGLGLAIVYAAVKNASGVIEVDSHPGLGTTFRLWLPLVEGISDPNSAEAARTDMSTHSGSLSERT